MEHPTENRRLSLDHLELYEQYCHRIVDEDLGEELKAMKSKAIEMIESAQEKHPLAGIARSGDREGGGSGSLMNTAVRVPKHRRLQMFVILYLNLLTGPLLVLLLCFLLWWILPFGTVLWLLYIGWMIYDNKHRPNPTVSRVK